MQTKQQAEKNRIEENTVMKVSIIGTGYVGLVTGTCFSDLGNEVICVDVDEEKIRRLKKGIIPIYEPGLEEIVKRNYELGQLSFTSDIRHAVQNSSICFIAVGTPMDQDGSAEDRKSTRLNSSHRP